MGAVLDGFLAFAFYATAFYYIALEFVIGNHLDKENHLRWDRVKLNLPGSRHFNPALPWLMKWNDQIENIAADIVAFVDDLRVSGVDEETAWAVGRQLGSRLQYLGIQDTPRKTKPPFRGNDSAWAGTIFKTDDVSILQTISQEKWDKTKVLINELLSQYGEESNNSPEFSFKRLEQIRGYLCHISMTYEAITPFLKGFHLTLCMHLPNRDQHGWRISEPAYASYVQSLVDNGNIDSTTHHAMLNPPEHQDIIPPTTIVVVPRLLQDLQVLQQMFQLDSPTHVVIRSTKCFYLLYGFCDASGKGFGSTMLSKKGIRYRIGLWGADSDLENTSNWKEFENSVDTLKAEGVEGNLTDSIVFINSDNSTVEKAFYKGNSTSLKLFKLVVRTRLLESKYNCKVFISHVSGDRMIHQGTDGISRGLLDEGVSSGKDILSFIPFDEDALFRHSPVEDWVKSWSGKHTETLTYEGCFHKGHDLEGGYRDENGYWYNRERHSTFLWAPPLAATDVALEQLRITRIKRQMSTHCFICPRLMTSEWMRQFHKAVDFAVEIPTGSCCWPENMFEPLILGVCLPYIKSPPWQLRGTPKVLKLVRKVRRMFKEENLNPRNLLREF